MRVCMSQVDSSLVVPVLPEILLIGFEALRKINSALHGHTNAVAGAHCSVDAA